MNISEISKPKNYDSEFCGSIPLNLINLVQPHGTLIVLSRDDLKIIQVSENVKTLVGQPFDHFINRKVSDFVAEIEFLNIQEKINKRGIKAKVPFNLVFNVEGKSYPLTATINYKDDYILLELEEENEDSTSKSFINIYQEIKYLVAALKEASTIEEIFRIAVEETRRISGFDRVMLYKFDKEWNGTVMAEDKDDDMEPYLHLRFPASDVPKQARELYFKNPFRIIPNRSYVPSRLMPVINPVTNTFTDLSECSFRGVASVHLEYLKNMNVTASMSTPLIADNKLWGIIACHHKTSKYLNFEMRSAFELLGNVISTQLANKERELQLQLKSNLNNIYSGILQQLYQEKNLVEALIKGSSSILNLLTLSGSSIIYNGETKSIGKVPNSEQLKEIVKWLQRNNIDKVYSVESLPSVLENTVSIKDIASGMIVLPISPKKGDYILGFRPEVLQTVEWGGNPNQAINIEADGKTYHPRNSFAIWKETVKYKSIPWKEPELEIAETLRTSILERIVKNNS